MRLLVLLSGGIDSPVAAHLMMGKGHEVDLVHFDNRPFTDDKQVEKVLSLRKTLSSNAGRRPKLFVMPHGDIQADIARDAPRRLGCVLCRRMMLRVASALAEQEGHEALVTGESLGQVASQTLFNLRVEEPAATVPVLRPLIGLDKEEIIRIARDIGSFEISTAPGLCCTIVPERPTTKAKMKDVLGAEATMDVEALAKKVLDGVRMVDA